MSEANAELLLLLALLFLKFTKRRTKKLPRRIERKRDSIEFERSENQGQFFKFAFLIFLNLLNLLRLVNPLYSKGFSDQL